jgi:hypothetical protein
VPNTSEHLDRARHNIRFAESFDLATTPYLDWVVTAYFYAALHLVEALYTQERICILRTTKPERNGSGTKDI